MFDVEQLYREYKPLLTSIAYRMLGSLSKAEDAVQDVFAAVSKWDGSDISHPKAYLVKMLANRVINMMKAAPRNRESYPGQWLPEPVIELGSEDAPLERVFSGIADKGSLTGKSLRVWISGQRGLLLVRENRPPIAFAFEPDDDLGAIRAVYLVSNPEKLTRITY
ncbi:RNA polymerase [Cohnella luojiensis]|uniref:RNA polymerase n=2 Tax=Cohnella luojiensis TaxID=652876 RepID=A0A4Y8LSQ4_9BACL|nr:RNA polymerase [Cohnella luojiensis]